VSLANILVPAYPDVPHAPGVPAVLRQVGAIENNIVMLAADAVSIVRMFAKPQWGLFLKSGAPAMVGIDSIVALDVRREYRISDYPIEQGAFASYNKVETPLDIRVSFVVSGSGSLLSSLIPGGALLSLVSGKSSSVANRDQFLSIMRDLARSLTMIYVTMPEGTYGNLNVVHYDYRREARSGATLLKIDIWLQEVRVSAKAAANGAGTDPINATTPTAITAPQNPASADPVNGGTVQATPVTPTQAATLAPAAPGNLTSSGTGSGIGDVPSTVRFLQPGEIGYNAFNNPGTNLSPADYAKFMATAH
jgi:hypothetical protein